MRRLIVLPLCIVLALMLSVSPIIAQDDTRTFESSALGFSFEHPADWTSDPEDDIVWLYIPDLEREINIIARPLQHWQDTYVLPVRDAKSVLTVLSLYRIGERNDELIANETYNYRGESANLIITYSPTHNATFITYAFDMVLYGEPHVIIVDVPSDNTAALDRVRPAIETMINSFRPIDAPPPTDFSLDATYDTPDGLTFDHPSTWFVEPRADGIYVTDEAAAIESASPTGKNLLVAIAYFTPLEISLLIESPVRDASEYGEFAAISLDASGGIIFEQGPVTIDGREMYLIAVAYRSVASRLYFFDISLPQGDYVVIAAVYTADLPAMTTRLPDAEAIIASIRPTD